MKIKTWMIEALIIIIIVALIIIGLLVDVVILNSDLPDIWKWYLLK